MAKTIFLSHSSKDKVISDYFIDDILVLGLSIKRKDIFCTSADGTKPESGEDWRESIKDALINSKIVILLITSNYKESEMCQNEMGAAWVCSNKTIPLILEPINYETVGVIQQTKQVVKSAPSRPLFPVLWRPL